VENFSYLGARVSTEGGGDEDIHERFRKAQVDLAFRRLSRSWNSSVYSTTTKVSLFNSLKAVLLHGSETWKMAEGNKPPSACEGFIKFSGQML